ncbi:MAG TPA: serine/threonine-protein kinase [Candidatus Eisenbacteria bacterium]
MARTDSQTRRQQIAHGLSIAFLGWLVLAVLYVSGVFETFDLRLLDWRFRLRGERIASDAIAIVGVDDATIRAYGAWPMPRDSYALLLAALEEAGARAIAVDLQFPEDRNQDPQWNRLLAQVTSSYENVVQAIWFHAEGSAPHADPLTPEAGVILRSHGLPAVRAQAAWATSAALPYPELLAASKILGHLTVVVDRDGAIRRLPMLIRYRDRVYPSLALSVFGVYRGSASPAAVRWSNRSAVVRWRDGSRSRMPLQADGSTAIDFAGDRGAFRHTYSMLEALQWYRAGRAQRLREAFAGRIVLLGLTSQREVSEDVGTTPFAAATPLLYIHANAIDNLLRDGFLSRPPGWLYLIVLGALSGFLGWRFAVQSIPRAALAMGLTVLGVAAADWLLLAAFGIDTPPSAALALAPLIYAGIGSHRYMFLERRSSRREEDIREGRSVQQRFLPEALVGQKLSHYDIVEKLGAGGMGVVYRGRDARLPRDVAVKVLTGGDLADEAMRRRFRREALAFSKLNHRHIATIFEFDSQDGTDFIVMEYVSGRPLSELLERGPLPERQALVLGIQIAEALAEAHGRGVLHRDLKPGNVMLTPEGDAKVLDFGVAKLLGQDSTTVSRSLTESGGVVGTLAYMAPEVLRSEPADARTDLYGLGMLLFEMTTGRRPFPDDVPHELMYMVLNQSPPEPRVLNAKISPRTQAIILKALEKAREDRYASAEEMLAELREMAATTSEAGRAVWAGREG